MWGCALGPFETSALMATSPRKEERKKERVNKLDATANIATTLAMLIPGKSHFHVWIGQSRSWSRFSFDWEEPPSWFCDKTSTVAEKSLSHYNEVAGTVC